MGKQFFLSRSDSDFQTSLPLCRLPTMGNRQKFKMQFSGTGHSDQQIQNLRTYLSRHGFEPMPSIRPTISVHLVEMSTNKQLTVKLLQEESAEDENRLTKIFTDIYNSKTFYEVLGVNKTADKKIIMQRYRSIAMQVRQ